MSSKLGDPYSAGVPSSQMRSHLRAVLVFLTHVHFSWRALAFRDILRSGTSVCVAVAGHRTICHPRGRRGSK